MPHPRPRKQAATNLSKAMNRAASRRGAINKGGGPGRASRQAMRTSMRQVRRRAR